MDYTLLKEYATDICKACLLPSIAVSRSTLHSGPTPRALSIPLSSFIYLMLNFMLSIGLSSVFPFYVKALQGQIFTSTIYCSVPEPITPLGTL